MDWTNGSEQISKYFTVKEAAWLPKWNRLANQIELSDDSKNALINLFTTLDSVREFLGVPMIVHCSMRPLAYNALIGGAIDSAHIARKLCIDDISYLIAACDFHPDFGLSIKDSCTKGRKLIAPYLYKWNLRMENNHFQDWIHLDNRPVSPNGNRIFIP